MTYFHVGSACVNVTTYFTLTRLDELYIYVHPTTVFASKDVFQCMNFNVIVTIIKCQ